MQRRQFITLLGGAAALWPFSARAQQRATPMIGYMISGTPETTAANVAAFRRGLNEVGFVEGRNVAVEYRWSSGGPFAEAAADLVRRRVEVIAASTAGGALTAKAATATIPIVFVATADAVRIGLVNNLARPEGNLTGINTMTVELGAKRVGLLLELLPQAMRLGVLGNPIVPGFESRIADAQAAAKALGRSMEVFTAGTNREIDAAFASVVEKRIDALVVTPAQLFLDRRVQITALAARHAIPTAFWERESVEAGGLMSYAANYREQHRLAGTYVGRILKGERPSDLPVLQPTKFELVINTQAARLLNIEVPPTLLAIADEVIE